MKTKFIPAPKKKSGDITPSKFVSQCVDRISNAPKKPVLDLPCGYGRHSFLFANSGYNVISADIDLPALQDVSLNKSRSIQAGVDVICIDASCPLPFKNLSFGIVVVVHYVEKTLLDEVDRILSPGGYLIFETFAGNGGNWRNLPDRGYLMDKLGKKYEFMDHIEKSVGPKNLNKVSAKLLALKLPD